MKILFILSLLVCLCGFYKYVYFISLGYGFSIAVMGIAMIFTYDMNILTLTLCLLLVFYGFRLGGYLLFRELKSKTYRILLKNEITDGRGMNIFVKSSVWISCALLYVLQVSPILFTLQNGITSVFTIIGAIIMIVGFVVESTADMQKSKSKKINPNKFCNYGFYKFVRCPNYFGEILFWSGVFVTGFGVLNGVMQWTLATIGYLCIVYIMFGGARRLEIRQDKNYGTSQEYIEYCRKTKIIIPLIPLYSVKKYKWLVGWHYVEKMLKLRICANVRTNTKWGALWIQISEKWL